MIQNSAKGYQRVKSSVSNLRLNTGSDGDDEMNVASCSRLVTRRRKTKCATPIVKYLLIEAARVDKPGISATLEWPQLS